MSDWFAIQHTPTGGLLPAARGFVEPSHELAPRLFTAYAHARCALNLFLRHTGNKAGEYAVVPVSLRVLSPAQEHWPRDSSGGLHA